MARRWLVTCDDCPDFTETHPTETAAHRAGDIHDGRTHTATMTPDELVRTHARFAGKIAAEAGLRPGETFADVYADALIGLWDAAKRWDPSAGLFATFAGHRARGQISDARRERDPRSRHFQRQAVPVPVSLDAPLAEDTGVTLGDVLVVADDPIGAWLDEDEAADRSARLREAVERLAPRLRHVIAGQLDGRTLADLGRDLDVTEARACQMRQQAIRLLRADLCPA